MPLEECVGVGECGWILAFFIVLLVFFSDEVSILNNELIEYFLRISLNGRRQVKKALYYVTQL